jgi:hypothetical protein
MTRLPVLFIMTKSNDATRKSQTHFEQVPVEVVKKIAEQDVSTGKKAGTGRVGAEPTSRKKG